MMNVDDLFETRSIGVNVESLTRALADNQAVIFVGAGASVAAGLPSWSKFLAHCLSRARQYDENAVIWKHIDALLNSNKFLAAAELLQWAVKTDLHGYIWDSFGKSDSATAKRGQVETSPSEVHLAIARMPFTVAVTTNYDSLLEKACTAMSRPPIHVCTWQQPDDIYQALRDQGRFTLIKTHGTATQPSSLILTHTNFRDLQSRNPSYNDLIAHLFRFRTCFFIGHSLQDPDILEQLSKARAIHGDLTGPHYAILFKDEKGQYELDHLESAYGIRAILIDDGAEDQSKSVKGVVPQSNGLVLNEDAKRKRRTEAVVSVLKRLHGQVAILRRDRGVLHSIEPVPFNRRDASHYLLDNILQLTGAFRGDICMVDDPTMPELKVIASHTRETVSRNRGQNDQRVLDEHIPPHTIIGSTFYRSTSDQDVVYLRDVTDSDADRETCGIPDAKYDIGHPDVRSELAVPIVFAGKVVGVLNVESSLPNAFTKQHLSVIKSGATEAGRIWNRAKLRQDLTRELDPCYNQVSVFGELIDRSRMVQGLDLRYILYEIDHLNGRAIPKLAKPEEGHNLQPFQFHERSLTNFVLGNDHRRFVPDVDLDTSRADGVCSKRGASELGYHGAAFGVALQKNGRPAAVLTCYSQAMTNLWKESYARWNEPSTWGEKLLRLDESKRRLDSKINNADESSKVRRRDRDSFEREADNRQLEADRRELEEVEKEYKELMPLYTKWKDLSNTFENATTRIERLAQLITNDSTVNDVEDLKASDAGKAIEKLNELLKRVDHEKQWTKSQLRDHDFQCEIFKSVCETLLQTTGYRRIRLWWVPKEFDEMGLVCVWSLTKKGSEFKRKPRLNAYRGVAAKKGSPYYDLVHTMSAMPPAARYHNVKMFGVPDENFELLDKKKDGNWIVVPILHPSKYGRTNEVIGCLSADMQFPGEGGEINDAWKEEAHRLEFHRYALELAADVLTPLLKLYRLNHAEIPIYKTIYGNFPTPEKPPRLSET